MASGPAIGLLGDVMLGRGVAERLAAEPPEAVWTRELRAACAGCDLLVVNLECCVSGRGAPTDRIPAKKFFFRAPPAGVEALAALGTTVAGLANNHALDFGPEALEDTLAHLERAGIAATGAGLDAAAARRGTVVEAAGVRVGVLAVSDHPREFAATPKAPGIAWAELRRGVPGWLVDEIAALRSDADLVLVFPHWGPNMTVRPAAWQRTRSRELLAAGAHVVAGHSAHVFHGVGRPSQGLVLYDLGDALDDYAVDGRLRNDLGVLAIWRPGREPESELELVGLHLDYCRTGLAHGADADWIAERLQSACAELGTAVERMDESRFAVH